MFDQERKLYEFMHGYGRRLLGGIPDEDYAKQPQPGVNHPTWILGHLTQVAQFGVTICGGDPWLNADWGQKFGVGSQPTSDPAAYPTAEEMRVAYDDGHQRLSRAMAEDVSVDLSQPNPVAQLASVLPTQRDLLSHILTTHEATHLGQLSAWRRSMGMDLAAF